jgi:hypothetical protein
VTDLAAIEALARFRAAKGVYAIPDHRVRPENAALLAAARKHAARPAS